MHDGSPKAQGRPSLGIPRVHSLHRYFAKRDDGLLTMPSAVSWTNKARSFLRLDQFQSFLRAEDARGGVERVGPDSLARSRSRRGGRPGPGRFRIDDVRIAHAADLDKLVGVAGRGHGGVLQEKIGDRLRLPIPQPLRPQPARCRPSSPWHPAADRRPSRLPGGDEGRMMPCRRGTSSTASAVYPLAMPPSRAACSRSRAARCGRRRAGSCGSRHGRATA